MAPSRDHLKDNEGTTRDVAQYNSGTNTTTVVNHLKYDSFGNITSQSNSAFQPIFAYTGQMWDADAGLYYYHARWYDPHTGRFLSQDPLSFAAGDSNLYRFVRNSPTNFIDPSGRIAGGAGPGAGAGMMDQMMANAQQAMKDAQDAVARTMNQMIGAAAGMAANTALAMAKMQRDQGYAMSRSIFEMADRQFEMAEMNLKRMGEMHAAMQNSLQSVGLGLVGTAQLIICDPTADFTLGRAYALGPYGQTTGWFHDAVVFSLGLAQAAMKRAMQLAMVQFLSDMAAGILDSPCFVAGTPVLVSATDFEPLIVDASPISNEDAVGSGWNLVAAGVGIGLIVCEAGVKPLSSNRRRRRRNEFGLDDEFELESVDDENCPNDRKLVEPSGKLIAETEMSEVEMNGKFVFEFTAANRLATQVPELVTGSPIGVAKSVAGASGDVCPTMAACPDQTAPWLTSRRTDGAQSAQDSAEVEFQNPTVRSLASPHRKNANPRGGWSRLRLAVGVLFTIACIARGLWGSAHDAARPRPAVAAVHASGPRHVAIETIRVGDRVLTNGPFGADAPSETAVNPLTWRHLRLEAVAFSEDGTRDVVEVETLQSPEWVAQHRAHVGAIVPLPVETDHVYRVSKLGVLVHNDGCGPDLFRQGKFPDPSTNWPGNNVNGQDWGFETPGGNPGFGHDHGVPGGAGPPDWMAGGHLSPDAGGVSVGPSAPVSPNPGGAPEASVGPGGVILDWFHMPNLLD